MAISASVSVAGVVRATWDDDLEQYREFGTDGVTVTLTRAYTAVELAQKAERSVRTTAQSNDGVLRAQLNAGITALLTDISELNTLAGTSNATINAGPAPFVKQLGAGLKRTNKSVVGLARIVSGSLSSADTGV